jgi:hypothetical protein
MVTASVAEWTLSLPVTARRKGGERVFDEAPSLREIEEVKLVDLRGNHEQRPREGFLGRWPVLNDFADLVSMDHRSGSRRERPPDLEVAARRLRRKSSVVPDVVQEISKAAN